MTCHRAEATVQKENNSHVQNLFVLRHASAWRVKINIAPAQPGVGSNNFFIFTIMVHELKTWEEYFRLMESGEKPFELRKNDRGFLTGHELLLCEYNPRTQTYTGRTLRRKITYILQGSEAEMFGLKAGFCILGLGEFEGCN